MVNTNSKAFREKVRAHIRTQLRGNGGVSKIVKDIDAYTRPTKYDIEHHIRPRTVREAAGMMVEAPEFLYVTVEQIAQLRRWGFKDYNNFERAWDDYKSIMVRELVDMYYEAKKRQAQAIKKRSVRRS